MTFSEQVRLTGGLVLAGTVMAIALGGCSTLPADTASTPVSATPMSCRAPDGSTIADKVVRGVETGCDFALAARSNALESMAISAIPYGSQVSAAVDGGCLAADGICRMAQSPTTQQWLATVATLFASKGKTVLPPPK